MTTPKLRTSQAEIARYLRAVLAHEPAGGGAAPVRSACLRAGLVTETAGDCRIDEAGIAWLARFDAAQSGERSIDPFRGQHLQLAQADITEGGERLQVTIDEGESPLAWLASRKSRDGQTMIDAAQFQAGERLRADFTRGQMTPRVTANWSVPSGRGKAAGGGEIADVIIAARQRVNQALEAVGPEFSGVLLDVCCFLQGLEQVERDRNWPARSAKIVLQLGLSRLARHYGLRRELHGANARIRVWAEEV